MPIHWRFVKNALANLGRGGAAAAVALLLPPILVRHMTAANYAVWVLILQTAAYTGYMNFGLQTAIGRYVAYARERGDTELRDSVFSTAFLGLCVACVISLVCLVVVLLTAPKIFPSVPAALIAPMRVALALVGFSMAAELPASACNGVFVGMERYEIPAAIAGTARLISAVGLMMAALAGKSIVTMAWIVAGSNVCAQLAQYLAMRRLVTGLTFKWASVRRETARELSGYCFGLTVVSFSLLLVTGLDLVLVGHFDFATVTPYSVAASMITFISGLLYAIVNVIMPHATMLHAQNRPEALGRLVISTTRISVLLLVVTGIPLFIYAGPIMRLWIGQSYVAAGRPILATLIFANVIRLVGAPYSLVMVAAGQHQYIKVSPLAEGITNFAVSIVLGAAFGGIGVALGTLIGSVIGVASHLSYSMPRTSRMIRFSRRDFLVAGVLIPVVWTSPLFLAALASWDTVGIPHVAVISAAVLSLAGAVVLLFRAQRAVQT
jgi:O-antigen/teichoic acid export membrane protein